MNTCRGIAHDFMSQVHDLVMDELKHDGLIADPITEALEDGFMPWLQTKTEERVQTTNDVKNFIDGKEHIFLSE